MYLTRSRNLLCNSKKAVLMSIAAARIPSSLFIIALDKEVKAWDAFSVLSKITASNSISCVSEATVATLSEVKNVPFVPDAARLESFLNVSILSNVTGYNGE